MLTPRLRADGVSPATVRRFGRTPVAGRPHPLWKTCGKPRRQVCTGWAYPCGYLGTNFHNCPLTCGFLIPTLWRRKTFDTHRSPVLCTGVARHNEAHAPYRLVAGSGDPPAGGTGLLRAGLRTADAAGRLRDRRPPRYA